MIDLTLNDNFSVFLDEKNELSTVEGRDEFEQAVRVMITDYMNRSVVGEAKPNKIRTKIRLQISRVAQEQDRIDAISNIDIAQSEQDPHTYNVRINYESDSISEFEVTE